MGGVPRCRCKVNLVRTPGGARLRSCLAMTRCRLWAETVEKVFLHRRAQILRAVGGPTRKLLRGTRRWAVNSPATSVVELRAYRMAIAACFVFQREISRSVFWDFFDSIDPFRTSGKGNLGPLLLPKADFRPGLIDR